MNNAKIGRDDMAIAGQSNQTLNKEQVRDLILSAQKAYHVQQKLGLADEAFDIWRKAALHDASAGFGDSTGMANAGILVCLPEEAGEPPRQADEAGSLDLDNECQRQAEAFGSYEGARVYAETLLGRIHRTTVTGATAKQLWQVMFTVRNRARAKTRSRAF